MIDRPPIGKLAVLSQFVLCTPVSPMPLGHLCKHRDTTEQRLAAILTNNADQLGCYRSQSPPRQPNESGKCPNAYRKVQDPFRRGKDCAQPGYLEEGALVVGE